MERQVHVSPSLLFIPEGLRVWPLLMRGSSAAFSFSYMIREMSCMSVALLSSERNIPRLGKVGLDLMCLFVNWSTTDFIEVVFQSSFGFSILWIVCESNCIVQRI